MQDEPNDADELNPRERGVMIGRAWAESQEADPITALQLATEGTIPDDVRTRERVVDALVDYIESPKAFWEGFMHGVRGYHWKEMQADLKGHIERSRQRMDAKKAAVDADVAESDAEWAEADAADAIDFAVSAIVEAEYATLDAMLARENAAQLATSSS